MTKLSQRKAKPEVETRITIELWEALATFRNVGDAENFFRHFFTPTEISMFSKRLEVIKSLIEGFDYQTIRETIKVTGATITRINNILRVGDEELSNQVKKLIENGEKRRKIYLESRKPRRSSLGAVFPNKDKSKN